MSNSTQKDIQVSTRGDFFLWLPGPGARHMIGKYQLLSVDDKLTEPDKFKVKPSSTFTFLVKILNQDSYRDYLAQEELDLSLAIRPTSAGMKFTQLIPFTKDALDKYYLSVDFDGK